MINVLFCIFFYILDTCCIEESKTSFFTGDVAVTKSGLACQPWSNQTSFQYNYSNNSLFPHDGSAQAAKNYCRDPDKSGVLWCYTASDRVHRDLCSVPICNSMSFIIFSFSLFSFVSLVYLFILFTDFFLDTSAS